MTNPVEKLEIKKKKGEEEVYKYYYKVNNMDLRIRFTEIGLNI